MSKHRALWILAAAGVVAAVGLWVGSATAGSHGHKGHHSPQRNDEVKHHARDHGGAGVLAYEQAPKLADALAAVENAEQALQANDKDEALKALAEAKELLAGSHKALSRHVPEMVNERCPIMGNAVDAESVKPENTRLYEGKRVGFCCAACPAKWDEMSDEQKHRALKEAGATGDDKPATDAGVVNDRCPIMGSSIDPGNVPEELTREYKGRKIGFCCGGCPRAWDRLSDEQKQAKLDDLPSAVD
ncbi:MAG: hypothetical protein ACLFVW_06705 [Phycisphaerae bacterium]